MLEREKERKGRVGGEGERRCRAFSRSEQLSAKLPDERVLRMIISLPDCSVYSPCVIAWELLGVVNERELMSVMYDCY